MAVEDTRRAHVVDLSRPGQQMAVEIDVSEAAELLVSMGTLGSDSDFDSFELGRARLEALRAAAPPDLLAAADDLLLGWGKAAAHLLGILYLTPKPRTVPAFLERLSALEPRELQLHLFGYYTRGHHLSEPETIERAAAGDPAAQREVVASCEEWPQKQVFVERLVELGGEELARRLPELVGGWYEHVFPSVWAEAGPLAERDAAEKRELARTLAPEQLIPRLSPGAQYAPSPDIHKIVLFPAYASRPWLSWSEHRHVKIFCYPIGASERPEPGDPADLARIYKALGDESRLKLLRRLQSGPISLAEAAQEVGLAKSTAHHHLAILRHAGFVLIRDEDDQYSLRPDVESEPGALLERFLRS